MLRLLRIFLLCFPMTGPGVETMKDQVFLWEVESLPDSKVWERGEDLLRTRRSAAAVLFAQRSVRGCDWRESHFTKIEQDGFVSQSILRYLCAIELATGGPNQPLAIKVGPFPFWAGDDDIGGDVNQFVFVPITTLSFGRTNFRACDLTQRPPFPDRLFKEVFVFPFLQLDMLNKRPTVADQPMVVHPQALASVVAGRLMFLVAADRLGIS